jgi:hypothetical protein
MDVKLLKSHLQPEEQEMYRSGVIPSLLVAGIIGLGAVLPGEAVNLNIGVSVGIPVPPPPPAVVVDVAPPIVVDVRPSLVLVPGSSVYYAPESPYNYFHHAGKYYVFHQRQWYVAPAHHGPWKVIAVKRVPSAVLRVPVTYYRVHPDHGHHHGHGHKNGHHRGHDRH